MLIVAQNIRPEDLVFDIGANVGDKTAWFADRGARVVAVEPQPALVSSLQRRFENNERVVVVPKGVAKKISTLEMSVSTSHVISTFSEEWKKGRFKNQTWDTSVMVEMTTLDHLVVEFGVPVYTKVDVEGFELEVALGLSSYIGLMSFEFVSENLASVKPLCEHLSAVGYNKFNVSFKNNEKCEMQDWKPSHDLFSFLEEASAKLPLLWGDVYAK